MGESTPSIVVFEGGEWEGVLSRFVRNPGASKPSISMRLGGSCGGGALSQFVRNPGLSKPLISMLYGGSCGCVCYLGL